MFAPAADPAVGRKPLTAENRFDPSSAHLRFTVYKLELLQVSFRVLRFYPVTTIPPVHYTYLRVARTRRTNGRTLETFHKGMYSRKSRRIRWKIVDQFLTFSLSSFGVIQRGSMDGTGPKSYYRCRQIIITNLGETPFDKTLVNSASKSHLLTPSIVITWAMELYLYQRGWDEGESSVPQTRDLRLREHNPTENGRVWRP